MATSNNISAWFFAWKTSYGNNVGLLIMPTICITVLTGASFLTGAEWGYCSAVEELCPWLTKTNLLLERYKDNNIGSHSGYAAQMAASFTGSQQ